MAGDPCFRPFTIFYLYACKKEHVVFRKISAKPEGVGGSGSLRTYPQNVFFIAFLSPYRRIQESTNTQKPDTTDAAGSTPDAETAGIRDGVKKNLLFIDMSVKEGGVRKFKTEKVEFFTPSVRRRASETTDIHRWGPDTRATDTRGGVQGIPDTRAMNTRGGVQGIPEQYDVLVSYRNIKHCRFDYNYYLNPIFT